MRRTLTITIGSSLLLAVMGCASIYHLDDYRAGDADADPTAPATTSVTVPTTTTSPSARDDSAPICRSNADCPSPADAPSVCVRSTGACRALATAECPRVHGTVTDESIVLGLVLAEPQERAALLAADEISGAGGGRPLVFVSCDPSGDAVAAARHLAGELRVPGILGPEHGDDVVDVTQEVSAKDGTLVMTPTAAVSAITSLVDDGLTWRVVPSDDQRAGLVINQMSVLEEALRSTRSLTSVKLAIVHRDDAAGQSARDSISGKLVINGRFINDAANAGNVSVDAYPGPDDATAQAGIASRYATSFRPDIVFLTAPEQVDGVLVALEKGLAAGRAIYRPYYVLTDAAKTDRLLEVVADPAMPPDLRRRIRGVGATSDTKSASVYAGFASRFGSKHGSAPVSYSAAAAYDATYAFAYALAASKEEVPSGAGIGRGLRALGVGAEREVGPGGALDAMTSLASGKSVSLRGANALLRWDPNGDVAGGTVEVWCIGTASGAPAFGSSGLRMDVETQVVGGGFVQCQ